MTSVVTTLLPSLVITSNTSLIMCLDAPCVTTPSHLPSCLSCLSHVSSHDPTRVSCHTLTCFVTTSRSQNVLRAQRSRGFTVRFQHVHRATARSISAQRVRCAISKCAPCHGESDPTRPKCSEGSLKRERFDAPKARRRFTLRAKKVHRATARAIRPAQSAQRVHLAC